MAIIWTPKLIKAREYFSALHESINQKRKYSGEPYFNHCLEVAEIVSESELGNSSQDALIAALGHDGKEDTPLDKYPFTAGNIIQLFGIEAWEMIVDLSDVFTHEAYPKLNRAERKKRERERLGTIRADSKTVKLADLISNTRDIVSQDLGFARTYIPEKAALLPYLADGSPILYKRASDQIKEYLEKIA